MTRLTKVVRRIVRAGDGRELVVTLGADGVRVRELGRRTEYGPLSYAWLHQRGGEMRAEETRRRRAANRLQARTGRMRR
jgi:Lon protease-like protein